MKISLRNMLFMLVLCVAYCSARFLNENGEVHGRAANGGEMGLPDIYQASMPAVMGMVSFNETLNILLRHFLTDKKDDSVWPKALEETKTWFGEDHLIGELDAIEVDLKKYRIIVSRCMDENKGKALTRCLATLKDALVAGSGNVEWSREQEVPKELALFTSFHLMEIAFLQMLKMQQEKNPVSGIDVDKSIKNAAKNFKEVLESSMSVACEQRLQRIGSLDLCKVTDVMWQEFVLDCEERIRRRSVEEGSGDGETENADAKSPSDLKKEDAAAIKISKLGGKQNDFVETMRARVKDRVTDQYIFDKK